MSENQVNSTQEQQPVEQVEQQVVDQQPVTQEAQPTSEQKRQTDEDKNWAEARKKMRELDRQNQELRQQIAEFNAAMKAQQEQKADDLDSLGDDEIVTKAQAKKLAARLAEEAAYKALQQRDASNVEERMRLKYPDFDKVLTVDNIEMFRDKNPSLAKGLARIEDRFEQAAALYEAMKDKGFGSSGVSSQAEADKQRAIKNAQKPISVNAVTKSSALGDAHRFENGLTKELKSQLWKEMNEATKKG